MTLNSAKERNGLYFYFLRFYRMYRQQGGQGQGFDFAGEAEKAARSVFVGNIPYEATEEQLKDIFSEVGVVVSFRLVYDRESGKPKGMAFILIPKQVKKFASFEDL